MAEQNPPNEKLDKLFNLNFYRKQDRWMLGSSKQKRDLNANLSEMPPKPKNRRTSTKHGDVHSETDKPQIQNPPEPDSDVEVVQSEDAKDKPLLPEDVREAPLSVDKPDKAETDGKEIAVIVAGQSTASLDKDHQSYLMIEDTGASLVNRTDSHNKVTNRLKLLVNFAVNSKNSADNVQVHEMDVSDQANDLSIKSYKAASQPISSQLSERRQDVQDRGRSDEESEYYGTPNMRWQLMYNLACSEIKHLGLHEPNLQTQMMPWGHGSSSDDSLRSFLNKVQQVPHSSEVDVHDDGRDKLHRKRLATLSPQELSDGMAMHIDALQKLMQENTLRSKKKRTRSQNPLTSSTNEDPLLGGSIYQTPSTKKRANSQEALPAAANEGYLGSSLFATSPPMKITSIPVQRAMPSAEDVKTCAFLGLGLPLLSKPHQQVKFGIPLAKKPPKKVQFDFPLSTPFQGDSLQKPMSGAGNQETYLGIPIANRPSPVQRGILQNPMFGAVNQVGYQGSTLFVAPRPAAPLQWSQPAPPGPPLHAPPLHGPPLHGSPLHGPPLHSPPPHGGRGRGRLHDYNHNLK